MKKSDVQRSYHQQTGGLPMVNVKHHLWVPEIMARYKGSNEHEFGDDQTFWEWVEQLSDRAGWDTTNEFETAEEIARESCWETALYDHQLTDSTFSACPVADASATREGAVRAHDYYFSRQS